MDHNYLGKILADLDMAQAVIQEYQNLLENLAYIHPPLNKYRLYDGWDFDAAGYDSER